MAISEWDRRQLCPDGGCVGVIGPDGTCKACGRVAPDWGDERRRGLVAEDDAGAEDDGEGEDDDDDDEILPSAPAALGEAGAWNRRRLCANGACIGVIGPDGTCKVCGTPASGEAPADDEGDEDDEDGEDGDDDEGGGDLADRKLCPDGACIGVIGPDGRCKVCGKEAA